jgi:DNA polymerase-3 subunit alpha
MVKIISCQSLGIEKVYDIGVKKNHNFILGNGLIASNCFNKSHSTAYAYVTYQTAYLKANYPTEYMTALLSASSGNTDKIEKYRENCERMGIKVEPPNINRSLADFTPDGDNILFGLSAIKNLGENAIHNIIEARKKVGGQFKSFAEFCSNIDLKIITKRALEPLIYAGAFDTIEPNRNQLLEDVKLIIPWVQNKAKEKEKGQMSMFDLLSETTTNDGNNKIIFDEVPKSKPVPDFSLKEKLAKEKEYLGFYVSEHPLKTLQESAKLLSPINLDQLPQQGSRKKISCVVVLNSIKKILTKNGDQMAFLQIEDATGTTEGIIFPSSYEQLSKFLIEESQLIVWGKVQKKDDKFQLIIDDIQPIEKIQLVIIELPIDQIIEEKQIKNLQARLKECSGDKNKVKIPVIAKIKSPEYSQFIRLGEEYWVQDAKATMEVLKNSHFHADLQPLINTNVISAFTETQTG